VVARSDDSAPAGAPVVCTRMSFIDREWAAFVATRLVRPVATPSATDLARGFRILAEQAPEHWLLWRVDPVTRSWIHSTRPQTDDLWSVDTTIDDGDVAGHAVEGNALPLGDRPFQVTVGNRTARLVMSHAFGDGGTMPQLLAALLRLPQEPDALLRVPPRVTTKDILVPALRVFGPRPRHTLRTLRAVLFPPRPPYRQGSAAGTTAADAASATVPAAALRSLRARAGHSGSDYSIGTLLLSLLAETLTAEGVPIERAGIRVLTDVRAQLADRPWSGNLARNFYMPVTRSWAPQDLHRDITAISRSGRPLASTMVSALGIAYLKARRSGPTARPPATGPALVAYSYLSRNPVLEALPWLDGPAVDGRPIAAGARRLVVATRVAGVRAITLHLTGVGDALHLTVSFCRAETGAPSEAPDGLTADAIRRALASVQRHVTEPDEHVTTRTAS
jgi:hypothetical protein